MGTTRASRCRRRAAHGCALFQAQARCGAAAAPRGALVGARRGAGGRAQVTDALARGTDVILRLDVQGAATVRRLLPGAVSVFLARACPRSARRACVCCMRRGPCCSCHRPGRCVAWRGCARAPPHTRPRASLGGGAVLRARRVGGCCGPKEAAVTGAAGAAGGGDRGTAGAAPGGPQDGAPGAARPAPSLAGGPQGRRWVAAFPCEPGLAGTRVSRACAGWRPAFRLPAQMAARARLRGCLRAATEGRGDLRSACAKQAAQSLWMWQRVRLLSDAGRRARRRRC